jgi:hypothetical protein
MLVTTSKIKTGGSRCDFARQTMIDRALPIRPSETASDVYESDLFSPSLIFQNSNNEFNIKRICIFFVKSTQLYYN